MQSLIALCAGKRVLIVNTIRSDMRSGGDTATRALLAGLSTTQEVRLLNCAPTGSSSALMLAFSLANVPAFVFVAFGRLTGRVAFEFFGRASPLLLMRCLWARWVTRPDLVVFNHHSSFIFSRLFPASGVALIWHDVPSLKRSRSAGSARDSRCCAAIQSHLLRPGIRSFTFSVTEARLLRRFHACNVGLLPAIGHVARQNGKCVRRAGVLLLVGNWHREENRAGAAVFFDTLARRSSQATKDCRIDQIIVAGTGASLVAGRIAQSVAEHLDVIAVDRFETLGQFDACALVVPVLRGAGIKIKTLEAWSHSLPVLGMPQAFSGLAPSVWTQGGLRFESIAQLVAYCCADFTRDPSFLALNPSRAMDAYLDQTGGSWAASAGTVVEASA